MLTHDGFLVVSALHNLGGEASRQELMRVCIPQISGRFDVSLDNAISKKLVTQLYIAVATRLTGQSSTPKKSIYKLTDYKLNEQLDSAKLSKAKLYIALATNPKNFHANYQAVVAGKRAKRDPVQELVQKTNPQDRYDLLKKINGLDAAERKALSDRLA